MQFNIITHSKEKMMQAFVAASVVFAMVLTLFVTLEPTVAKGQYTSTTETFNVTTEITGEISFVAPVANATMTPSIQGISGGTSNGNTSFQVNSNDPAGYEVRIAFTNPGSPLRLGNGADPTKSIPNFGGTTELNFLDGVGANEARFGFTVSGPNVVNQFKNNGSACDQSGGTATGTSCWWLGDTSGGYMIVESGGTANEEEHGLHFRVHVEPNPDPVLDFGVYTATATLTLVGKTP